MPKNLNSHWNYRLILHDTDADPSKHWIGLHEVFYDGGKVDGWTAEAINFVCDLDEGADAITTALQQALKDIASSSMLKESEAIKGLKQRRST